MQNQCTPLVCGFNFVYILYERFNNITMLKVLVLSLYNSVLNIYVLATVVNGAAMMLL